jgi:hypothetical protein
MQHYSLCDPTEDGMIKPVDYHPKFLKDYDINADK